MILTAALLPVAQATPHIDSIYLVMVDRYANGNPTNDGQIDLEDPAAFHGGDLLGLTQHLDDIESLGIDTVWLTPITKMRTEPIGVHGAFHGYWVEDGRAVEPRFGRTQDIIELREALKVRGMKLLLDIVLRSARRVLRLRLHERRPLRRAASAGRGRGGLRGVLRPGDF